MPQFLYKIRPSRADMLQTGLTDAENLIVTEHFNYLQALTAKGTVLLAGRTLTMDESSFGIVIFECASELLAHDIMQHDPAVVSKLMHAELFPFRIVMQSA